MEAEIYNCENDEDSCRKCTIDLDIKDLVLTPYACATIVTEILKTVLYQKLQIPYPYNWLKNALGKRKAEPNIHSHNVSVIVNKYFNLASNVYRCIENMSFNLNILFTNMLYPVQELVILFGSTPYTPKEVLSIRFPTIARGHNENVHRMMLQKKLHTVLRKIFFADEWLAAMQNQIAVTNTFVFIKKLGVLRHEEDYFEHYNNFVIPPHIKQTTITLNYSKNDDCCDHLQVYGDESVRSFPENNILLHSRNVDWYQAKDVIKGFHDFFIEKVSVSELW